MNPIFTMRGHNNAHNEIQHPGLRQLIIGLCDALTEAGEPFRVRHRMFESSEVVKVFTLSTNNQMHFSVLFNRRNNVHAKFMCFRSVFQDEARAGWTSPKVCDYRTLADYRFHDKTIEQLTNTSMEWLGLNGDNARIPRTPFLAHDNRSEAPSEYIAASFMVDKVRISSSPDIHITLSDKTQQHKTVLSGEYATTITQSAAMVGCRAVIHKSGTVRVLREANFKQLYELVTT